MKKPVRELGPRQFIAGATGLTPKTMTETDATVTKWATDAKTTEKKTAATARSTSGSEAGRKLLQEEGAAAGEMPPFPPLSLLHGGQKNDGERRTFPIMMPVTAQKGVCPYR